MDIVSRYSSRISLATCRSLAIRNSLKNLSITKIECKLKWERQLSSGFLLNKRVIHVIQNWIPDRYIVNIIHLQSLCVKLQMTILHGVWFQSTYFTLQLQIMDLQSFTKNYVYGKHIIWNIKSSEAIIS